ncbi:lipocalin family protein [Pseudomonadota bacterium]
MKKYLTILFLLLCFGCKGIIKEEVQVVQNFNLNKYLGTWYEIARLDHKFEKGLEKVSANYSLDKKGRIIVFNQGYNPKKDKWKSVKGKAKLIDKSNPNIGKLKVSFFWPFYGDYNIIVLDKNYQYAIVTGRSKNYLWILSRNKKMDKKTLKKLVANTKKMGFETEDLIYVKQ